MFPKFWLLVGWIDGRRSADFGLTAEAMRRFWDLYLNGADPVAASPARGTTDRKPH